MEDISNPTYWRQRLAQAQARRDTLHTAVFRCPLDRWKAIEAKHRQILARHVHDYDAVLDVGCGWGRLLTLMPANWRGMYLGIDLSPDFIALALAKVKPDRPGGFLVGDIADPKCVKGLSCYPAVGRKFDCAICISMKYMVIRNQGEAKWLVMEQNIKQVARQILFLEYDPDDDGVLQVC